MSLGAEDSVIMLSHALRSTAAEAAGMRVGHYLLEEKLGDGGFGSVWRATQDEPVRREVALKVIKLGMDTLEVINRFEQERVALSLMDHPNIAKVLDAGATLEGRPFFAMELVRGTPVTAYCLKRALPLEQRLSLFRDICAGVQHAHQRGIIHRDLKPSNILVMEVDGVPVPKIIDFGIAKALTTESLASSTLRTRAEQMMGTPLYMSPEQAQGTADIDTRSDIYALGVILYELLTGRPPFDAHTLTSSGRDEMRRIIREVEPAKPSNIGFQVLEADEMEANASASRHPKIAITKDLDLITLRALAKDRARRYDSAAALAEDIQRFLNHEPVTARAPNAIYLLQRWMQRHHAAAVAAIVSVLAISTGTGVAVWQAVRATQMQHAAERQLVDAEAATRLVTETLATIPGSGPESLIRRADLTGRLVARVRAFQGDPMRKAALLVEAAKTVRGINSVGLREEAVAIAIEHLAPDNEWLWSLQYDLAVDRAKYPQWRRRAVEDLRRISAWFRARLGPKDQKTVEATYSYARNLNFINEHAEAARLLSDVVRESDSRPSQFPAASRILYHIDLARALIKLGEKDKAHEASLRSVKIAQEELGMKDYDTGRALLADAQLCQQLDLLDEAAQYAQQALEVFIHVGGPLDGNSETSFSTLVAIQQARGDTKAILDAHHEFLRAHDAAYGPAHPATAQTMKKYSTALLTAGETEEADKLCRDWIARVREQDGTLPATCEEMLRAHIEVLRTTAQWSRAERALRDLVAMVTRLRPEDEQTTMGRLKQPCRSSPQATAEG